MTLFNATSDPALPPGLPLAFVANMDWMSPKATRLPESPTDPWAWFNPLPEDMEAIAKEGQRLGAKLVVLDFEGWSQYPTNFPRMASLLRHFAKVSGLPACFYPGQLSVGAASDQEIMDLMAGNLPAEREHEIAQRAAQAAVVMAACDVYTPDSYAYTEEQLESGQWEEIVEAHAAFRARYYPAREVIPFAGAHYGTTPNPQIKPALLPKYVGIINQQSTHGRKLVWSRGEITSGMKWLARLLSGETVDVDTASRVEAITKLLKATQAELG